MQTDTEKTKRSLKDRGLEAERARAALDDLEAQRAKRASAFADDLSTDHRTALLALDERIRRARLDVEAMEARERKATAAHEAAVAAERRTELDKLLEEHDSGKILDELHADLVEYALTFEREFATRLDRARGRCAAQRSGMARARELAELLGAALPDAARDVRVDEMRVIAGCAVNLIRRQQGRMGAGAEHFVTPLDINDEQHNGARRFLAQKGMRFE